MQKFTVRTPIELNSSSALGLGRMSQQESCHSFQCYSVLTNSFCLTSSFACGACRIKMMDVNILITSPTIVIRLGATHMGTRLTTQFHLETNRPLLSFTSSLRLKYVFQIVDECLGKPSRENVTQ
jgi:hypothetical protein